ncbi:cysteine desulfurase family protein [Zymobacter palmae]|uniref:cysteine desulfurase n=1 Tax=Zymobacter palmae TaxID=33074 RepID=A0A348HHK0_9GAMM|nr:aminotransferase class V-fold PLP-dependent enzyme [Zymobacter palmae]BBG31102.1 cysteine sulfinate desulfinase [Zymobacter palmae]
MPRFPLYFDYAASTPVDPRVADIMAQHLTLDGNYANPASRSHMPGWLAEQAVEIGRRQVADTLKVDPREIIWTSGATEADNLALIGFMRANADRGRHLITSIIEHKAVIDTARYLEEEEGVRVTWLTPEADGRISPAALEAAISNETALVSLMAVNNEVGSINDLKALGDIAHAHGAAFHVDGAQAIGHIPLDLSQLPVDMLSLSGHKAYGPKGVGALYIRRDTRVAPLIHGGGHERGYRSGTLPTHQIAGMGKAFEIINQNPDGEIAHLRDMRQRFLDGLQCLTATHINGPRDGGSPHLVNLAFEGIDGETLMMEMKELAVSTGSACNSASLTPSFVLTGIGLSPELALSSVRFSFGRFTTAEDIDVATQVIMQAVRKLRPTTNDQHA